MSVREGGEILVQRSRLYLLLHSLSILQFMSLYLQEVYFPLQANHVEKDFMPNSLTESTHHPLKALISWHINTEH